MNIMSKMSYAICGAGIDICCPHPCCGERQMLIDGTDRRTEGRTPDLYIDRGTHIVRAASISYRSYYNITDNDTLRKLLLICSFLQQ